MKIYLVWSWFEDDEPMVVAVADSLEKAEELKSKVEEILEGEDYEFSIDEREINTTTYD